MKRLFLALVATTALLASVAVSATAAETPFKGKVNAVETGTIVGPTRFLVRDGGGTATQLGKYTEHITMQINLPTRHSMGAATFTAANGDTLTATVEGQATPASPGMLSIIEVYTITGGTGRFAGATGTFTLESIANQATGVNSGTFSGAIDH